MNIKFRYMIHCYVCSNQIQNAPIPAVTNEESLFAGIAILHAISLTMLTPWLCFEKIDPEEDDVLTSVTSPELKSTN